MYWKMYPFGIVLAYILITCDTNYSLQELIQYGIKRLLIFP